MIPMTRNKQHDIMNEFEIAKKIINLVKDTVTETVAYIPESFGRAIELTLDLKHGDVLSLSLFNIA